MKRSLLALSALVSLCSGLALSMPKYDMSIDYHAYPNGPVVGTKEILCTGEIIVEGTQTPYQTSQINAWCSGCSPYDPTCRDSRPDLLLENLLELDQPALDLRTLSR